MKLKYGHLHKSDKHKHKWGKYKSKHSHKVHHNAQARKKYTLRFKNKAAAK